MQWIKRAWLGEEKTVESFLGVCGCLASIPLNIITVLGFLIVLPHIQIMPWHAPVWVYALCGVWGMFLVCYTVWGAVAPWKCSSNTNRPSWGYAARVVFILGLVGGAADIAGFPGDSGQNNIDSDSGWHIDCQKMMHDYASKHGLDPQKYISQNQAYLQECPKWPHFYDPDSVTNVRYHDK